MCIFRRFLEWFRRRTFGASAVGQDFAIGAACFLQGIGKDGQALEGSVVVYAVGLLTHGAAVPLQPSGIDRYMPKRVAKEVTP